jgi:hypothetical protein
MIDVLLAKMIIMFVSLVKMKFMEMIPIVLMTSYIAKSVFMNLMTGVLIVENHFIEKIYAIKMMKPIVRIVDLAKKIIW